MRVRLSQIIDDCAFRNTPDWRFVLPVVRVPDACKFDLHVLLVEHGKVFKNDVGFIRKATAEQLGGGSIPGGDDKKQTPGWMELLEQPGGIKDRADTYFFTKSGKSVCGWRVG
jgi:hypothetical protein